MPGKIVSGDGSHMYYVYGTHIEEIVHIHKSLYINLNKQFPDAVNDNFYIDGCTRLLFLYDQWFDTKPMFEGVHRISNKGIALVGPIWLQEDGFNFLNLVETIVQLRAEVEHLKYAPCKHAMLEEEYKNE